MKEKTKKRFEEALEKKETFSMLNRELNPPTIKIQKSYHFSNKGEIVRSANPFS